jgi:hypothetical protein
MEARPEWHDAFTRVYRVALSLGDPGDDTLLASLQDEARLRLPTANLSHRVAVIATTPAGHTMTGIVPATVLPGNLYATDRAGGRPRP